MYDAVKPNKGSCAFNFLYLLLQRMIGNSRPSNMNK